MLEQTLAAIRPYSPRRAAHKELALFLVRALPRLAERATIPAHLTASLFILDPARERVLLVHHPRFHRWLQPGGHCDGDVDLRAVALREAAEETGLDDLVLDRAPFDVDIHPGEPSSEPHMHVDVRFVAVARAAGPVVSPEGLELRWFGPDELDEPPAEAAAAAIARAGGGSD